MMMMLMSTIHGRILCRCCVVGTRIGFDSSHATTSVLCSDVWFVLSHVSLRSAIQRRLIRMNCRPRSTTPSQWTQPPTPLCTYINILCVCCVDGRCIRCRRAPNRNLVLCRRNGND